MQGIIRIGDLTTGGGVVLAGSTTMKFGAMGVARVGDPVMCPVPGHGMTVIVQGHSSFKDNGQPVAFNGHVCACGCLLISSMPQAGAS
ncbi:PAAR domain-containing protein [Pseudomonas sp. SIMBA_077]